MPLIDRQFREKVTGLCCLFLLGASDVEIDKGLTALEAAGLSPSEVEITHTHLNGELWGDVAAIVRMKPPTRTLGPLLVDVPLPSLRADSYISLPLQSFYPANGARSALSIDGLQMTTSATQWAYSLTSRIRPYVESVHGLIVARLCLKVEQEKIGIATSRVDDLSNLIHEIAVQAAPEVGDVEVDVPDGSRADLLIIRNQSGDGPSRAMVYSVDVLRAK